MLVWYRTILRCERCERCMLEAGDVDTVLIRYRTTLQYWCCKLCKQGNYSETMSSRCWFDIVQHCNADVVNYVNKVIIVKRCRHDVDLILNNINRQSLHNIKSTLFNIAMPTMSMISMKHRSLDIPLKSLTFRLDLTFLFIIITHWTWFRCLPIPALTSKQESRPT